MLLNLDSFFTVSQPSAFEMVSCARKTRVPAIKPFCWLHLLTSVMTFSLSAMMSHHLDTLVFHVLLPEYASHATGPEFLHCQALRAKLPKVLMQKIGVYKAQGVTPTQCTTRAPLDEISVNLLGPFLLCQPTKTSGLEVSQTT